MHMDFPMKAFAARQLKLLFIREGSVEEFEN